MSVILRHAMTGFHYAGRTCWVNGARRALDLETVERAIEVARKEALGGVEIIAWFDPPGCQLVFPVRFTGTRQGKGQPVRDRAVESESGHAGLSAEEPLQSRRGPRGARGGRAEAPFEYGVKTSTHFPSAGTGRTSTGDCSLAA